MAEARDTSSMTPLTAPSHAVQRDLEAGRPPQARVVLRPLESRHTIQIVSDASNGNVAPVLKRRPTRASTSTSRAFRAVGAYPLSPEWHAGQEPGLDPSKPDGGWSQQPALHADCDITVVDYSEDDMMMYHLNNPTLPEWLEKRGKRGDWVKCRWIDVNGLSWDVIQALGTYKRLHRLAIEDLINTRNRTKADWYYALYST
jgi:hypothetical protein